MQKLRIRREVAEAFRPSIRRRFEEQMVERVKERAPHLARVLGKKRLRAFVLEAIGKAERFGFTFRGPTRLVIDLCLYLGSGFEEDPQHPWVQEHIGDPDPKTQMQRAESLFESAIDFLRAIAGEEQEHANAALIRLRDFAEQPPSVSPEGLHEELLVQMWEVYPERAEAVGEAGLRGLIAAAEEEGERHGLLDPEELRALAILMFAFGRGCFSDPLYPWIGDTLANELLKLPGAKARQLHKRARTWTRYLLAQRGLEVPEEELLATGEWELDEGEAQGEAYEAGGEAQEEVSELALTRARPLPGLWSTDSEGSLELPLEEPPTQAIALPAEEDEEDEEDDGEATKAIALPEAEAAYEEAGEEPPTQILRLDDEEPPTQEIHLDDDPEEEEEGPKATHLDEDDDEDLLLDQEEPRTVVRRLDDEDPEEPR